MNSEFSTQNQFKQGQGWGDLHLPGFTIKEEQTCGSATIYLFQRTIDNLRGVFVRGETADDHEIDKAMQKFIQTYGSIHLIFGSEKLGCLAKYLPQGETENKALSRVVRFQQVQPTEIKSHRSTTDCFPSDLSGNTQFGLQQAILLDLGPMSHWGNQHKRNIEEYKLEIKAHDSKANGLVSRVNNFHLPRSGTKLSSVIATGSVKDLHELYPEFTKPKPNLSLNFLKFLQEIETYLKERERLQEGLNREEDNLFNHKKNEPNYELYEIYTQHAPWSQSISHLENLALNMQSKESFKLLRGANLGNNLIMNVRLLAVHLKEIEAIRQSNGLWEATKSAVRGTATGAAIHPAIACISLVSSIVAIAYSCDEKVMPPLTKDLFLDAINNCILPLIQDVHDSLVKGQKMLANQTDEQTTILMKAIELCAKDLNKIQQQHKKETNGRFDSLEFNHFIEGSQKCLQDYRKELLQVKRYIKGNPTQTDWISEYVDHTLSCLDDGKKNAAHGFNGASFNYPLKSAFLNPIYVTGIIHHSIFGNDNFPVELAVLDSAAYTFIHFIRKFFLAKRTYGSKELKGLSRIANKLLNAVQQQIQLFEQLLPTYKKMVMSHEKLMMHLKASKIAADNAKKEALEKVIKWEKENKEEIRSHFVGQKMYQYSQLLSTPLMLESFQNEIYNTLWRRSQFFAPHIVLLGAFTDIPWHLSAKKVDGIVCSMATLRDLPISIFLEGIVSNSVYTNAGAKLSRRIWTTDHQNFSSSVTVSAESRLPFKSLLSKLEEVPVIDNPPTPPKNPLVDCTVIYDLSDGRLKTVFDKQSRLQMRDLQGIPGVRSDLGSKRMDQVSGTLGSKLYSDDPRHKYCLSLNDKSPKIVLPTTLMAYMKALMCPEFDKIELMGAIVDLRYSFVKSRLGDKYQLCLHVVYGESMSTLIPYQSRCIFEVDAVTVESYAKDGEAPNLIEFLYSFIYYRDTGDETRDGIPDSTTYVKEGEKGFIAPGSLSFVGLFAILEKYPHLCFSFDHRRYNINARNSIGDFLKTGKLDERARKFFISSKTEVNFNYYMGVQQAIRRKVANVTETSHYKEFEKNYTLFITLATLSSQESKEFIRKGLKSARIIPPSEIGWLEQAYYYEKPDEQKLDSFSNHLKPSLAKQRLDFYAAALPEITNSLGALAAGSIKLQDLRKFADQMSVLNPSKARSDLEEDSKIIQNKFNAPVVIPLNPNNPSVSTKAPTFIGPQGIVNLGATCFINSSIQALIANPLFYKKIKDFDLLNCQDVQQGNVMKSLQSFVVEHEKMSVKNSTLIDLRQAFFDAGLMNKGLRSQDDAASIVEFILDAIGISVPLQIERHGKLKDDSMYTSQSPARITPLIQIEMKAGKQGSFQNVIDQFSEVSLKGDNDNKLKVLDENGRVVEELEKWNERAFIEGNAPHHVQIQLQRFTYDKSGATTKIEEAALFPTNLTIDMTKMFEQAPGKQVLYRVKAAVIHVSSTPGSINAGHYYSLVEKGGQWIKFDDSVVTSTGVNVQAELSNGYLFFLEKI